MQAGFKKGYKHVSWAFLKCMLKFLGFGVKVWSRTHCCISMIRISILVMSPLGFFSSFGGLRQGDLLSSFLFVLAFGSLEGWLQELQREVCGQAFKWVAWVVWNDNDPTPFCWWFLNFLWVGPGLIWHLEFVLLCFDTVSGLRIWARAKLCLQKGYRGDGRTSSLTRSWGGHALSSISETLLVCHLMLGWFGFLDRGWRGEMFWARLVHLILQNFLKMGFLKTLYLQKCAILKSFLTVLLNEP